MAQLSDTIEQFIKTLMDEDAEIELKRNELAQHFNCAPSQINYVLATRFSVNHGYIIESRRGGGGYIRLVRVTHSDDDNMLHLLLDRIGGAIDEAGAVAIIRQLYECKLVTENEAMLMRSAVLNGSIALPTGAKDIVRASVLSGMIRQVFRNHAEANR